LRSATEPRQRTGGSRSESLPNPYPTALLDGRGLRRTNRLVHRTISLVTCSVVRRRGGPPVAGDTGHERAQRLVGVGGGRYSAACRTATVHRVLTTLSGSRAIGHLTDPPPGGRARVGAAKRTATSAFVYVWIACRRPLGCGNELGGKCLAEGRSPLSTVQSLPYESCTGADQSAPRSHSGPCHRSQVGSLLSMPVADRSQA
jgi:hypothetical protein